MGQRHSPGSRTGARPGGATGIRFWCGALAFVSAASGILCSLAPAPDLVPRPAPPAAPASPRDPRLPSIWVAGDSTAAVGAGEAQQGWAVLFAGYFDPAR